MLTLTCFAVLCDRIHRRVDKMMSKGLLQELAEFHADYNKERCCACVDCLLHLFQMFC